VQGVQAVGDPDRVLGFAIPGPCGLERFHFLAQYVPAAVEHAGDGRVDLGFEFQIGGAEVEEGDVHVAEYS